MEWFRWYHGTVSDPKFAVVAKRSGQPKHVVLACWSALIEFASTRLERGSVGGIDCEEVAITLDLETEQVESVFNAMEAKCIIESGFLKSWKKRQPKREDETGAERKDRWKQAKKNGQELIGTQRNATERNGTQDDETERLERSRTEQRREEQRREERELTLSQDAGARVDHSLSCLEKLNNSPADPPRAEAVTTPVQAEVSNSQEKLTSSPAKQPPISGPRQDAYSQEFLMLAEQYPRKDEGVAAAWIAFKALKNSGMYPGNTFVLPILVAWRASPQWMDDGGRYVPSFSKWIRERRWEAGPPEDPQEKLNRQLNDLAAMAEMKKAGVRQ